MIGVISVIIILGYFRQFGVILSGINLEWYIMNIMWEFRKRIQKLNQAKEELDLVVPMQFQVILSCLFSLKLYYTLFYIFIKSFCPSRN